MRSVRAWLIAFHAVSLVAAGCHGFNVDGPVSPAGSPPEARVALGGPEIRSVLEYYRRIDGLNEEELQMEFSGAQQAASDDHRLADRIRLAVLLGLPRAPFKDYDRSLTLLNEAAADPAAQAASKDLLLFLASVIQGFKRQGEQYQKLDLRFREEKKQHELLQQKLDELTTIEKRLQDREQQKSP